MRADRRPGQARNMSTTFGDEASIAAIVLKYQSPLSMLTP
jgi:hypothetical protein